MGRSAPGRRLRVLFGWCQKTCQVAIRKTFIVLGHARSPTPSTMFSFLPFVLLLLASAAGYTKTSSFLGQTRNLTIMVSNDPNSRVTVAESGAAEIVFSNDMYASKGFDASDATKQPIGEEQGSCITVAGGNASVEYECSWTNSFDNQGSITVQGKWLYNVSNSNDQFEYGILAITGGTGSYIGAAGEVRVNCPEESEPSLAFCTYDFGWRSLFQSSDGEVDESSEDNENNNNEVED
mmetsp:Transcript_31639/g.109373  ORF Transcript_31639/g.109373 Transcript_31639/m.109373 type:complete len:237 (+) Transcript_31639:228-938(+)